MALVGAAGYLAVVVLVLAIMLAFGSSVLDRLKLAPGERLEGALYAAGLSFSALQIAVFLLGTFGWLSRRTLLAFLVLLVVLAGRSWLRLREYASAVRRLLLERERPAVHWILVALVAGVLSLDFLVAMAPLTGSDALHYHFTVPLGNFGKRFRPDFFLTQSFETGLTHMLIQAGLVLGSDHLALGLLCLGGLLAAGALFQLARQLMSTAWALCAVLVFLLTPLVYWQMTVAGAPDVWMAYYTTLTALAATRGVQSGNGRWVVLAGLFAGAAAGAKYTGWAVPATLCLVILWEKRSFALATLAGLAAISSGIYPLVRNFLWAGDPFFPFFSRLLAPQSVNPYVLAAFREATGFGETRTGLGDLFSYPFRMVLQGMHNGVGHYLGPVVLAFCPLLLVGLKNVPLERIAAALWAGVFLSNALTSQMGRFLLPILPVALALVLAAVVRLDARRWRVIRLGCVATLLVFLLFAAGTYAVYAKDFLPVVVGLESREAFLERIAPDYQICRFVNEHLAGEDGKAVVFFRHLYYLRVPFVFVDPNESWEVNPDRYQAPEQWMRLFRQLGVRWVVKAPDFPVPLRGMFEQMEADGLLRPVVLGNLETFEGWRISRTRVRVRVVIYQVARPGLYR